MATYVIGDLQGCADEFDALLMQLGFSQDDQLWLVGDLVNRGPASARVMARILELSQQDQVTAVLGNHDLHFLATYFAKHKLSGNDTFQDVLASPRVAEFAQWMCQQSLLHYDPTQDVYMSHAGIPHVWTLPQARELANEVQLVLCDQHDEVSRHGFFESMYGNKPNQWHDSLQGLDRLKLITNYFTRMRLINAHGELEFAHKGSLQDKPDGYEPWYSYAASIHKQKIVFGHWASLAGYTGVSHIVALDTGCVYGRTLTALCLETGQKHQLRAKQNYFS